MKAIIKKYLPVIEGSIVYVLIFTLFWHYFSDQEVFICIAGFFGVLFCFFYGIVGLVISIVGLIAGFFRFYYPENFLTSLSTNDFVVIIITIALYLLIAGIKKQIDGKMETFDRAYGIALRRIDSLLSQLVSIDMAYKRFLEKFLIRLDKPIYLYQELRQIAVAYLDEEELFSQIFSILNRYAFVEAGCVYKKEVSGYKKIIEYRRSKLPFEISKNVEWVAVLEREKDIIQPAFIEKYGFLAAVPVISTLVEKIRYLFVIEQIRSFMITKGTMDIIKVTAFITKIILETYTFSKEIQQYSLLPNIILFKPEFAPRILKERITFLEKMMIPYSLGYVPISKDTDIRGLARKLELSLRDLDEKYLIDNKLVILFIFAEYLTPIKERLKEQEGIELREIKYEELSLGN